MEFKRRQFLNREFPLTAVRILAGKALIRKQTLSGNECIKLLLL